MKMINKKLWKSICGIILIIFLFIPNVCLAFDVSASLGNLEQYGELSGNSDIFQDKVGIILGVVQLVGSLAAVICLIVLGVKYMTGSVEEKAEYKKTLLPYFIGAMMVFGITNLLKVVYEVMINIT